MKAKIVFHMVAYRGFHCMWQHGDREPELACSDINSAQTPS